MENRRLKLKKPNNGFGNVELNRLARMDNLQKERKNTRAQMFLNNRVDSKNMEKLSNKVTPTKYKEIHKQQKGKDFGDISQKRVVHRKNLQEGRKNQRSQLFLKGRKFDAQASNSKIPTPGKSNLSNRLKKSSSLENRPPFVVGIVHYPLCPIPPLNIGPIKRSPKNNGLPEKKKISKVTEKILAAKNLKFNENISSMKKPAEKPPRQVLQKSYSQTSSKKDQKSTATLNRTFDKDLEEDVDKMKKRKKIMIKRKPKASKKNLEVCDNIKSQSIIVAEGKQEIAKQSSVNEIIKMKSIDKIEQEVTSKSSEIHNSDSSLSKNEDVVAQDNSNNYNFITRRTKVSAIVESDVILKNPENEFKRQTRSFHTKEQNVADIDNSKKLGRFTMNVDNIESDVAKNGSEIGDEVNLRRRTRSLDKKKELVSKSELDDIKFHVASNGSEISDENDLRRLTRNFHKEEESDIKMNEQSSEQKDDFAENFKDISMNLSNNLTSTPNTSLESMILKLSCESRNTTVNDSNDIMQAMFSPFIVRSRGKDNARKEEFARRFSRLSSLCDENDIPTKETVMEKLSISAEEEEKTAQHFMLIANKEVARLEKLCDQWLEEMENVPQAAKQKISYIVENTKETLDMKMGRFLRLVSECQVGRGENLVSCKDLQSYWDNICEVIRNFDSTFCYLNDQKMLNWPEASELPLSLLPTYTKKRLLSLDVLSDHCDLQYLETPTVTSTPKAAEKSLSEELKLLSLKPPEVELDDSVMYINSEQIPGRSILKSSSSGSSSKSRKSRQRVNFNETVVTNEIPSDNEPFDQKDISIEQNEEQKCENEKKLQLIDSYFGEDEPSKEIQVGRKLNFDDSDYGTPKSIFAEIMEVDSSTTNKKIEDNENRIVQPDDPINLTLGKVEVTNKDEDTVFVKSLRNRTICTPVSESSKTKRKRPRNVQNMCDIDTSGQMMSDHHTHKHSSMSENDGHKLNIASISMIQHERISSLKRQRKKSVKFDEETCTVCTPQKLKKKSTPRKTPISKRIRFD